MSDNRDDASGLLAQADALMRRHRVFLADSAKTSANLATPPAIAEQSEVVAEDDLPVLTEVVALHGEAYSLGPNSVAQERIAQQLRLEASLSKWLDEELPQTVLRVVDGFSDRLIAELVSQARKDLLPMLMDVETLSGSDPQSKNGNATDSA